jgi:hypothetical protein
MAAATEPPRVICMPSFRVVARAEAVPVEGGRWMLVDGSGQSVLGDRDFAMPDVAYAAWSEAIREGRRRG